MNFRNWPKKRHFYRVGTTIHIFGWPAVACNVAALLSLVLIGVLYGWRLVALILAVSVGTRAAVTFIRARCKRNRITSGSTS